MNKIGIFGLGCVGQGLVSYLESQPQLPYHIQGIVIKQTGKKRPFSHIPISTDASSLIDDPSIDTIVEVIDDAHQAFEIAQQTLLAGKNLVTANKKMMALHLAELIALQEQTGKHIFFEAAVGGSIPIITLLDGYFRDEPLTRIRAILNGTTNYILTKIFKENINYQRALQQAQQLGFAEREPQHDVSGKDAWFKTKLLSYRAFGVDLPLDQIFHYGIEFLTHDDIQYARSKSKRIKLVPVIWPTPQGLAAWVIPHFVDSTDPFFNVDNENNSIEIDGQNVGLHYLTGKGAGALPTAGALIADLQRLPFAPPHHHQSAAKQVLSPTSISIEVYVRDRTFINPENLPFDSIREGYLDDSFHYLIGYVPLHQLLLMKPWLEKRQCTVVATGLYQIRNEIALHEGQVALHSDIAQVVV